MVVGPHTAAGAGASVTVAGISVRMSRQAGGFGQAFRYFTADLRGLGCDAGSLGATRRQLGEARLAAVSCRMFRRALTRPRSLGCRSGVKDCRGSQGDVLHEPGLWMCPAFAPYHGPATESAMVGWIARQAGPVRGGDARWKNGSRCCTSSIDTLRAAGCLDALSPPEGKAFGGMVSAIRVECVRWGVSSGVARGG